MGLEVLEEKYRRQCREKPETIDRFREIADEVAVIQTEMRRLFDDITPVLCRDCKAPCCQCMPVEGWFTENDYFVYRARYEAPFALRQDHGIPNGCAFLGEQGCVLPADIRPFPCVKVNCRAVRDELQKRGRLDRFAELYDALERLQAEIWPLLK